MVFSILWVFVVGSFIYEAKIASEIKVVNGHWLWEFGTRIKKIEAGEKPAFTYDEIVQNRRNQVRNVYIKGGLMASVIWIGSSGLVYMFGWSIGRGIWYVRRRKGSRLALDQVYYEHHPGSHRKTSIPSFGW